MLNRSQKLFILISGIFACIGILFILFWGCSYLIAKNFPEKPPMGDATKRYEEKFSFALSWPFFYKYYLYKPEEYDPKKKYPLVVLLHGVSRHMYGGAYILNEAITEYPSFVLVPIAPKNMVWGSPQFQSRRQAYPLVMNAIKEVKGDYAIDKKRIYVSGYSMGGYGTYAMIAHYPDVFAAALVLCGAWNPKKAESFPGDVPILAAHGTEDNPERARKMIEALEEEGKPATFLEYESVGHNVWDYVYTDMAMWEWLYSHRRDKIN